MKQCMLAIVGVFLACLSIPIRSGIPLPDAVLFGSVRLGGVNVLATDDVTLLARVEGVSNPIGRYRMGTSSVAGDFYVLRIPLDFPIPGSKASSNSAQLGQTITISVVQGVDAPKFLREYRMSGVGVFQMLDLDDAVTPGQCASSDNNVALDDHQAFIPCLGGPGSSPSDGCDCADLDGDRDTDLLDWSRFQLQFTGSP